ncbi:MAG: DUF6206 family protein [Actinomycetota bacterium]|nr:DUF6206 family protein [Actinomycetota bacterium]
MYRLEVDTRALEEFERGLDPRHPDKSRIPAAVLGYGEISTVFEIGAENLGGYAFKRLPLFRDMEEINSYSEIYMEYNRLLSHEIGIDLPPYGYSRFISDSGRPIFYIIQEKLNEDCIGNNAIHHLSEKGVLDLIRLVLRSLKKVWDYNYCQDEVELAVDGQISNWCIVDYDPGAPRIREDSRLIYMDTSTPLFRVGGEEQLDPYLFLRSAPSFLVWVIKALFVQDVIDRYYDHRRVTMDLIANFYKEQRSELIPAIIDLANDFFASEASYLEIETIREKDVRSYYREDAFIWVLYLNARRLDRFLRGRLLRKDYPHILPGRIKR